MAQEIDLSGERDKDAPQDEPEAAVVKWGEDPDADDDERRFNLARLFAGRRFVMPTVNRQLIFVVGGLSALAVFASLVGEWQTTVVADNDAQRAVTASVASIPGWGTTYLVGVVGLVVSAALAMFGASRNLRRNARVAGLALAGAQLTMLLAAADALRRNSAVYSFFAVFDSNDAPTVTIGRGLHMAFVSTIGIGVGLYLLGRAMPAAVESEPLDETPFIPAARAGEHDPGPSDIVWRRPRQARAPIAPPDSGPPDLTVSPAAPFVHLPPEQER